MALSHLALEKTQKAIPILQSISEQPSNRFYQASQWYLALAFLKDKQKEKAKNLLNIIQQNTQHPFSKKTKKILESLD